MPTIDVRGSKINYLDAGKGTPVVMVHSGGMSSRQWTRLVARLESAHRVVAPDLLGSGNSDTISATEPFDYHQDVAVVEAILATLDAPYHLVGHSYGGLIALTCARANPTRVRSLSLFEPVAFGVLYSTRDEAGVRDLEFYDPDGSFLDDKEGGKEPWMESFIDYWNGPGAWRALPEPSRAAFMRVGRKVFQEVRSLLLDRTPHDAYAMLPIRTVLLTGARSTLAAQHVCEVLSKTIPHSELIRLEGIGHMGPMTHAQIVNDRIVANISAAEI